MQELVSAAVLRCVQELVSAAVFGVVISLACVPIAIVIFTHNVFMAIIATTTIALICASVVGLMPIAGFKLGVSSMQHF